MRQFAADIGQMVVGFIFFAALFYAIDNYVRREVERRVGDHWSGLAGDMEQFNQIRTGSR